MARLAPFGAWALGGVTRVQREPGTQESQPGPPCPWSRGCRGRAGWLGGWAAACLGPVHVLGERQGAPLRPRGPGHWCASHSAPTGLSDAAAPSKVRTRSRACGRLRGHLAVGATAWPAAPVGSAVRACSQLCCPLSPAPRPLQQHPISHLLVAVRVSSAGAAVASAGSGGQCCRVTWLVVVHTGPHVSRSGLTGCRPRLWSGEAEPHHQHRVGSRCPEPLRPEQPPGPPRPAAPCRPAVSLLGREGERPGLLSLPGVRGRGP